MNLQKSCRASPSSRRSRPPQLAVDSREFVDLKMTLLTGTKGAFAQLGIHAARFRTRAGRRGSRPCRTSLHVLRGRRAYCVRLYYAMQPTRVANPGLAAYKPPPRTVMTYTVPLTFEREAIIPAAVAAPEPETVGASAPQLREEKKAKPQAKEQVKAHSPPRARPVRQQ